MHMRSAWHQPPPPLGPRQLLNGGLPKWVRNAGAMTIDRSVNIETHQTFPSQPGNASCMEAQGLIHECCHLLQFESGYWRGARVNVPYVQDLIEGNAADVCELLLDKNGHVYVCGDGQSMARDVHAALATAMMMKTKVTAEEADKLDRILEWLKKNLTEDDLTKVLEEHASQDVSISQALQELFHDLQRSEDPVGTVKLMRSFGWDSTLEQFQQHDAHELEEHEHRDSEEGDARIEGHVLELLRCQHHRLHVERRQHRPERRELQHERQPVAHADVVRLELQGDRRLSHQRVRLDQLVQRAAREDDHPGRRERDLPRVPAVRALLVAVPPGTENKWKIFDWWKRE